MKTLDCQAPDGTMMLKNSSRGFLISRIVNIFIFCLLILFLVKKVPVFLDHYQDEGRPAPRILVTHLDGSVFDSDLVKGPFVVVFWATWCPPCEVELRRLNGLILDHKISAESVVAISLQEEPKLVRQIVGEREYKFQVAVTSEATLAKNYKVVGTPTIIFIDSAKTIQWVTAGLSPTLEYRVKKFLKN